MEYNELITRAKQTSVEVPDTDSLLKGMHETMCRRERRRRWMACASFVIVVSCMFALATSANPTPQPITLAEQVSEQLAIPPRQIPAPIAGYHHSVRNHQIYTLL